MREIEAQIEDMKNAAHKRDLNFSFQDIEKSKKKMIENLKLPPISSNNERSSNNTSQLDESYKQGSQTTKFKKNNLQEVKAALIPN